jgi:hypothetical protein
MQQILYWTRCFIKQNSVKGIALFLYVLGTLVDYTRTKFQHPSSSELQLIDNGAKSAKNVLGGIFRILQ